MVLRGHMTYKKETDIITFKQPIIKPDAKRKSLSQRKFGISLLLTGHSYDAVR